MPGVSNRTSIQSPLRGTRWALMIINDESSESKNSEEVLEFVKILKNKEYVQPENIIFLRDKEAQKEQIIDALDNLGQIIKSEDTVVIRFSNESILSDTDVSEKLDKLYELATVHM